MSFYGRYVLPFLTDVAMSNRVASRERARWVPRARGIVLEIGAGSGRNGPFYGREVEKLLALEPSEELRRLARRRMVEVPFAVEFLPHPAEEIPLGDGAVDSVITTWTLCTVADPPRALAEMRRVLRGDGRLIFVEHGQAPDPSVVTWQDRLTPLWRRVAGGCHLNRPIADLLAGAGFVTEELETSYTRGPRVSSYLYRGIAQVARTGDAEHPARLRRRPPERRRQWNADVRSDGRAQSRWDQQFSAAPPSPRMPGWALWGGTLIAIATWLSALLADERREDRRLRGKVSER
jgi:SAM-dependent methyltransferase